MDTSKYKTLFIQEAEEHLGEIVKGTLNLEKDPHQRSLLDDIFRHFHSIKGMAASMGYEAVVTLSHQLEGLIDGLRGQRINPDEETLNTLLNGADILRAMVNDISEDKIPEPVTVLAERIDSILSGQKKPVERPLTPLPSLAPSTTMKVDGKVFDDIMARVGEVYGVRATLVGTACKIPSQGLREGIHRLGRSLDELHETVLTARMIPLEVLTQGLPRVVRDLSKRMGKEVELSILGEGISLDKAIIESLGDPLIHTIRNAIDHGIEGPEERERLGKSKVGKITIVASRERDGVIVEIGDDGRGIDVEKVKEKALSMGISMDRLKRMTDREILSLICLPGLTLARGVTDTSGRGVGMDAVKVKIEAIRGTLEIDSIPNQGTRVILMLPLSVSIIKVLLVSCEGETFAIPMTKVNKVMDIGKEGIDVPLFNLKTALKISPHLHSLPMHRGDGKAIVILEVRGKMIGMMVDNLDGEMDAYIKPLPHPINRTKGLSGFTTLGDGRPAFVLEVGGLVQ